MPSKIFSAAVFGLDCQLVEVEADISAHLPGIFIVGLPDKAVEEAKERVRSAVKNSGLSFPRSKVTINLAPADLKKEGPAYDLPIAVSILAAAGEIKLDQDFQDKIFIGELSLEGKLRPVNGVISISLLAQEQGKKTLFLPQVNAREASLIPGLEIIPLESLSQLVEYLKDEEKIKPLVSRKIIKPGKNEEEIETDMSYIKGQEHAKRALEIAAAGGHNLLMSGPPGAGKTLLARALPSILPALILEEALEVTKIYSVAGLLPSENPLIKSRPFRSPHHSASLASLVGGGRIPKPGEISLAHRGVLFLDELPEFPRSVLESLRQPLEEGVVTVARVSGSCQFPARFVLVAAQNPCPCGFLSDPVKECTCTPSQIIKYQKRISGPLLDRIDLHVEVPRLKFEKLAQEKNQESSKEIRKRVEAARLRQAARFKNLEIITNSEMTSQLVKDFCPLDSASQEILKKAVNELHLSARAYFRILKVARTIADLLGTEGIKPSHLAEALQYRTK